MLQQDNLSQDESRTVHPLNKCFHIPQRYILYILSSSAIAVAYSLRTAVEVATVPEDFDHNKTLFHPNTCPLDKETTVSKRLYEHRVGNKWIHDDSKLFLSSFYWSYVITQLPAGYLANKFGGKHILTLAIFGSSLCNFIHSRILLVSVERIEGIICVRVANGFFQGAIYPCLSAILIQWSPMRDRATICAFVFGSSPLGYMISKVMGAFLIKETHSWKMIFYFVGSLGIIWCISWQIFCYSKPEHNPFISSTEKNYLLDDLEGHLSNDWRGVPWRRIMTSGPVWALVFAGLGYNWAWFTLTQHLSEYLNKTLKIDITHDEYWIAIPFACTWILSIIAGCLSDWLVHEHHVDVLIVRKFVMFISLIAPAVLVMFASFLECDQTQVVFVFSIATSFFGAYYCSGFVNVFDLAPNFTGFVSGFLSSFTGAMGIVSPVLVGMIAPHNTLTEWQHIFWMTFFFLTIAALAYMILGNAREQEWNNVT